MLPSVGSRFRRVSPALLVALISLFVVTCAPFRSGRAGTTPIVKPGDLKNLGTPRKSDRLRDREEREEREEREREKDRDRKGQPGTDDPEGALQYRLQALRDENGDIPPFAVSRAWAQRQAMVAALRPGDPPDIAGITPGSWAWRGPGNIGGRIRSLVIHPTTPTTMFAGGVDGGIWKSTNGGVTWAPVNDFLANIAVSSIVFQPGNPAIMYAGTGEGFYPIDASRGEGIFKSVDGGTTWSQLANTVTTDYQYVNRLAMSADGTILLAATRTGIFRSTDGGAIFNKVLTIAGVSFIDAGDVKFLPGSSLNVVASGFMRNAYWSNNGGATFNPAAGLVGVNAGGGDNFDFRVELGTSVSAPGTVYASVWGQPGQTQGQLWKSTDSGGSYGLVSTPNHLGAQGWYDNAIWVDPTNVNTLIIGGIDLYRSTNAGANFTKISSWQWWPTSAHADHHMVISQPGFDGTANKKVYFANDGGLYRTDDPYAAPVDLGGGLFSIGFTEINNNLGVTQFYGGAGHAGTGKLFGGTQDNGTVLSLPAGGTDGWTFEFSGDGGMVSIDQTNSNFLYGEYVYGRAHRSSNGGTNAEFIFGVNNVGACKAAPFSITDACNATANFIAPLLLDPGQPNRLLVGGLSLWRTDDARTANTNTTGPTWAAIKASNGSFISAIAIAAGNSDVVWVGHSNGDVYFTTNGTQASPTWNKVDTNPTALPNRAVTSITILPSDANTVYVTFGGFNSDDIYKTTTSGGAWADVTGSGITGLPSVPVRAFAIHPTNTTWLYAGTEIGVFASSDGGVNWGVPQDGPANVSVYQLFWMGSTLVAATHGRGMFTVPVPTSLTSTLTRSPSPLNFGATKNGAGGALASVTPAQAVTVGYTGASPSWTATSNQPWAVVTGGSGAGNGQFTVSIANPGNVIGGFTNLSATITISAPTANAINVIVNLTVQQTVGTSASPYGQVDAPAQSASNIQGAIGVSGWVLDDVGVADVKIYRNCLAPSEPAPNCVGGLIPGSPGTQIVFVGDAAFVAGVRPDLEAAFPGAPQNYRAGWGLLVLTNMLPRTSGGPFAQYGGQGPLTLYAIATDIEGNKTLLGRVWTTDHDPTNITMANDTIAKPFGAIDTPTQGGNASTAAFGVFGWVLTPDLNTIADGTDILMPTNGSTLFVYVDGAPVANVTYNQCRGSVGNPPPGGVYCDDDVASIFGNATPQPPLTPRASNPTKFRNLDAGRGPQGSYALNTTLLSNGLHSIAWSATDSNGRIDGIGSRNFIVLNGGARPVTDEEREELLKAPAQSRGVASTLDALPVSARPVSVRTGYDPRTTMKEIDRGRNAVRTVTIGMLGRVELGFAGPVQGGYLVANGTLRDLPVGSSLNTRTGVFAWIPALGSLGTYRLAFIVNGERVLVDVTVALNDPDGDVRQDKRTIK